MQELKGDLFDIECDALCVTTNGFVKNNGEAVMGKGCAKQLAEYYPETPERLGYMLNKKGNKVHELFKRDGVQILSFPVKTDMEYIVTNKAYIVKHMQNKFALGSNVPGWACVADISIIEKSAKRLVKLADKNGWKKILLPRPGCGAGELSWNKVQPVLNSILDDRFYAVTFK
jgi:hypothetical protein